MADNATYILNSKLALPNKLLQSDGTVTTLLGDQVVNPVKEYDMKSALPNKFLNPDGTYSTLNEILSGAIDTDLFVVVEELPASGDEQKIYLVPDGKGGFVEYHWTGSAWDAIGAVDIDLSNYSTTQEMMNAIEAACTQVLNDAKTYANGVGNSTEKLAEGYADAKALETLTSANAYTDSKVSSIPVSVYNWLGGTGAEDITLWQKVVDASKTMDVIVFARLDASIDAHVAYISKGMFENKSNKKVIFMADELSNSAYTNYSIVSQSKRYLKITFVSTASYEIASLSMGAQTPNFSMPVLVTDIDYQTPYTPLYSGSPATKKYVDDSIADNITNVLGGSY